ncbi:hypothetical protein DW253_18735 [Ruminococcus sp. AM22-13]|nr:hypothetical protein DW253_18735 [Ruminococcus sp. AM22-13]
MAINGTTAYCVKRGQTGSAIYVIKNIADVTTRKKVSRTVIIPYAVYGMTYCKNYLFMTCYKNKVIKMPVSSVSSGTITEEFTVSVDGNGYIPQSISYYGTENNEDLFLIGVGKMNKDNSFFYMIGTLENSKFIEKKRFYVKGSAGYEQAQGTFYHSKYGLFIATNKLTNGSATNYNMILCARIPDKISSVDNGNIYIPESEFRFNGNSRYASLAVRSLCISDSGILYISTNAVAATAGSEYDNDVIFRATNPVFPKNGLMEFTLSSKESLIVPNPDVTINGSTYTCANLGAFALNGTTGYCLLSHTTDDDMKDKASVLLSSPDISSKNFTRVSGSPVLRTMGHGNGMTYANGFLYVAAYDRDVNRKEIAQLDPATGNIVETYQCDHTIGGISYYGYDSQRGKDLFIVVNYDDADTKPYAQTPEFFIGYLESKKFVSIKNFYAQNPSFNAKYKNYLQDIFYSPLHGLFYVPLLTGTTRIYRLLPEQIEQASDEPLVPVAVYNKDDAIYEIESLAISDSGTLYIAQNCNSKLTKDDAVTQIGALSFISK